MEYWRTFCLTLCVIEAFRCASCALAGLLGFTVGFPHFISGAWTGRQVLTAFYLSGFWGLLAIAALACLLFRFWDWRERLALCCVASYGVWLNALSWEIVSAPNELKPLYLLVAALLALTAAIGMWLASHGKNG